MGNMLNGCWKCEPSFYYSAGPRDKFNSELEHKSLKSKTQKIFKRSKINSQHSLSNSSNRKYQLQPFTVIENDQKVKIYKSPRAHKKQHFSTQPSISHHINSSSSHLNPDFQTQYPASSRNLIQEPRKFQDYQEVFRNQQLQNFLLTSPENLDEAEREADVAPFPITQHDHRSSFDDVLNVHNVRPNNLKTTTAVQQPVQRKFRENVKNVMNSEIRDGRVQNIAENNCDSPERRRAIQAIREFSGDSLSEDLEKEGGSDSESDDNSLSDQNNFAKEETGKIEHSRLNFERLGLGAIQNPISVNQEIQIRPMKPFTMRRGTVGGIEGECKFTDSVTIGRLPCNASALQG